MLVFDNIIPSPRGTLPIETQQRMLGALVPMIKEDLLKPHRLRMPDIPVRAAPAPVDGDPWIMGQTRIDFAVNASKQPIFKASLIRIAPTYSFIMRDDLTIAHTLAHEMVHASLAHRPSLFTQLHKDPHGPVFEKYMRRIGLTGQPDKSVAGPEFVEWFNRRARGRLEEIRNA